MAPTFDPKQLAASVRDASTQTTGGAKTTGGLRATGYAEEKVFVVTGAAGGIGAAIVRKVVEQGGKIVIGDVNEVGGQALAAELGGDKKAVFLRCDVCKEEDIAALMDEAVKRFGTLDCAVNNAGRMQQNNRIPFWEVKAADFDATMGLNYRGVFLGMVHAARVMVAQGVRGSIVNMGSISGMRGCSYEDVPYQLSKANIITMTKTGAAKLVASGIRVNCVSPSLTDTGLIGNVLENGADLPPEVYMAILASACPMTMKMLPPAVVADAVLFLCSEAAANINGVNLPVDQGITSYVING